MLLIFCLINLWLACASQSDEKPVLQEILVPRKLVENQTIRLNCDLIKGAKPIRFSWYLDDEPIRESERLEIENRRDSSSLMIKGLSVDSVGRYKCVGANDRGSDQQTVAVYVNSKSARISVNSAKELIDFASSSQAGDHQRPAEHHRPPEPAGRPGLPGERLSEGRGQVDESRGEG